MSQKAILRHASFLDSSLRLNGITAILNSIKSEKQNFSKLFILSNIKFKKSYLKYLDFCKKQEFVLRTPGINASPSRGENHKVVFYSITDKGRKFLELLE